MHVRNIKLGTTGWLGTTSYLRFPCDRRSDLISCRPRPGIKSLHLRHAEKVTLKAQEKLYEGGYSDFLTNQVQMCGRPGRGAAWLARTEVSTRTFLAPSVGPCPPSAENLQKRSSITGLTAQSLSNGGSRQQYSFQLI